MIFCLYIMSAITIYLFYESYKSYVIRNTVLERGIVTDGIICEIKEEEERGSESGALIIRKTPYMAYTDREGVEHKYEIKTTSVFAPYHLDSVYKLVYDPMGEHDPLVMTRFGLWGDVLVPAAVGFSFFLFVAYGSNGYWW